MAKSKKILGIDLGTTYSCVAFMNEYGQAEVIPNAEGERTTPSVVWFDGKKAVVGQPAKEMANLHPDLVCSFVKRNMGNDDFTFDVDGVRYTPEHVSSLILRKLVKDASSHLGEEIKDVVVTCPAYFFIKEREATKRAAEIAGLNLLSIVNEPTAAAFAYGIKPNVKIKEQNILVYDLGGGTFDTTVIRTSEKGLDVVCTEGDHQLGGKDWDDHLVQHLAKVFAEKTQQSAIDDLEFYYDLLQKAEQCKKQLTDRKTTKTNLSYQGEKVPIEIARETFEKMTEDLLERSVTLTQKLIAIAREKGCTEIHQLILVGGSSRMPQVANRLRQAFSLEPLIFEPDEAVAKGAAVIGNNTHIRNLLAQNLERRSVGLTLDAASPEQIKIASKQIADEYGYTPDTVTNATKRAKNVASKTFGITVLDGYDDKARPVLSVSNLIYRNTPLPVEWTEHYATIADKQSIVVVELVENDYDPPKKGQPEPTVRLEETIALWNGELAIQPDLPKYSPIDVTFRMDENGRLFLCAVDPASGKMLQKAIPEQSATNKTELEAITKKSNALIVD